jgi:hypothetical protein
MKNLKISISSAIVIISTLTLALTSCGGGGGGSTAGDAGGTTEASLSVDNAPSAGAVALQSANLVGSATVLGELRTSGIYSEISSKTDSAPLLRSILDRLVPLAKSRPNRSGMYLEGSIPPTTENCTGGGTVTVSGAWSGPDNPTDPSQIVNFAGDINFNSCKESTTIMNGSMSVVIEGPLDNFTRLTVSIPIFTYANTATNDNITMTNLYMDITDFSLSGDAFAGATITISGAISGTVVGDPINVGYDGFVITFSSDGRGETVSMSGGVRAACLGGWVTIITAPPLFFPAGAVCPTTGEVTVTSSGNSVRIAVASDSQISVYYNNTLVQTYTNCENVAGLCVG